MGKHYQPLLGHVTPREITAYLNSVLKTILPQHIKQGWYINPYDVSITIFIVLDEKEEDIFKSNFASFLEDSHYQLEFRAFSKLVCLCIEIPAEDFQAVADKINGVENSVNQGIVVIETLDSDDSSEDEDNSQVCAYNLS